MNVLARCLACTVLATTVGFAVEARDEPVRTAIWAEAAKRQAAEVQRRQRAARLRWEQQRHRSGAHARMPNTLYASTRDRTATDLSCPVLVDEDARRIWRGLDDRDSVRVLDARSRVSARSGGTAINVFSGGRRVDATPASSSIAVRSAVAGHGMPASGWSTGAAASAIATVQHVYLFPSASEPLRQGFVRVINHSGEAGDVRIEPIDDSGRIFDALTLSIDADATVHFNSGDLENGNAGKGLTGQTGSGEGDWRLAFTSDLDMEVLAYVRTRDGFLTAMHDVTPAAGNVRRVAIFNPGSNRSQASRLRLVNPTDATAEVVVRGTDDRGEPGAGEVVLTLDAGTAQEITAAELESGVAGLEGMLGDGSGKWRLEVVSERPVVAMSLLESPTDHLTNLSTVPSAPRDGKHPVPLFPAAGDASGRQGFLRVVNRSDSAGEVRIEAFDETDRDYGTLTLSISGGETVHFNSDDLEQGSPRKGLSGGTGAGEGDWRLRLMSDLDIEVLAYIRTEDGFLTAMHDVAPSAGNTHRVAVFNPGSNRSQASLLRVVNPTDDAATVTVSGIDGKGDTGAGKVRFAVPAGRSRTVPAWELEDGGDGLEGALGDGAGKWQLALTSDAPVVAMSLLRSPTGHLTNLSTAPGRGATRGNTGDETAEEVFRDSISAIVQSKCVNCHVEGGASGNTRLLFVRAADDDDHLATNLAVFEDFLAEVEDGADLILNKIQGVSHGGGIQVAAGTEEFSDMERFLSLLGEDVGPVAITPDTLFDGVRMEPARSTLRRAAIVFAGRVPTEAEYESIRTGGRTSLRTAIRGLMKGPQFHEFLIRGSNDRLLTDRDWQVIDATASDDFVDFANLYYHAVREHYESGGADSWQWYGRAQYGVRRAPLELIAYVVENDLPYTEVLTADYIMANPAAAAAYGASTSFRDADDDHEFRPSEIVSYYRDGPSKVSEFFTHDQLGSQAMLVTDPGDLVTDYPHAGILNTTVFLLRYPTTATNRNRARSRWTYYHFLGVDIEKSASRTTDPVALADTNNPTMHNPACTVCHTVMDPVAGAFQNYGDAGFYRDQWEGLDSLDDFYKEGSGTAQEFEITAAGKREPQTISVSAWLKAGRNGVRLIPSFDPPDVGDEIWWNMGIDRVEVFDDRGELVESVEVAELDLECGEPVVDHATGERYYEAYFCPQDISFRVGTAGVHEVAVKLWVAAQHDDVANERRLVDMRAGGYQEGDTWYRDVRDPGFDGELAPDRDSSLQWLAQRIVADSRFAEATVKFWWPALMGADVAAPPPEGDPGFEGRLLASNAQTGEIERLARGFRRGFGGGAPYNLKDLLVEMVLSRWFRAKSLADAGPVRTTALEDAGARRLLTPEELSRKTVAVTGFDWRRHTPSWSEPGVVLNWTNADWEYGLLYGGIDSGGITKRGRDLTAIMAGVAKRHASAVSCPVVMKDFFLVAEEDRRLFGGADLGVSPVWEFGSVFEIEGTSRDEQEVLSLGGHLRAGSVTVRLHFTNDFYDESVGDRNVLVDNLIVRRTDDSEVVHAFEFEEGSYDCGGRGDDHWNIWSSCSIEASFDIAKAGSYEVQVVAWADQAGGELAKLRVSAESDVQRSAGSRQIRGKIAELYGRLLGEEVNPSSPDVLAAFDLFVDAWRRARDSGEWAFSDLSCDYGSDDRYFDGILDDIWVTNEHGDPVWDWDRVNGHLGTINWHDGSHVARAWVVVLAYLMTDYGYLHL